MTNLITWRLKEIMNREGIGTKDLAKRMKLTVRWAQKTRAPVMPGMNQERLEDLLMALNVLRKPGSDIIRIQDLIAFSLTPEQIKQMEAERAELQKEQEVDG